jgi:uncharacterized membrane protein
MKWGFVHLISVKYQLLLTLYCLKTYLTYAPISLFVIWFYLMYSSFKSQREYQKAIGEESEVLAYKNLKERSRKNFRIWIISILIFVIVTFIVGILTAKA